ncbi:uncharacterized protein MYCFIDRAFT_198645 [Pseudocercospora fijiensis CIRAD86]|uniref:Uncharacterized protein n=1 Tax=Pseudocercospora fijiensis (strain CIRAD86) TaxID=383855 RepID=M2YRQ9_PSEFD|nr:uncharacterized protein MYCFIDRAFT_198645 [Pseudocercospora fijiensis CIRAD86]EME80410.1 hypothetical protein MYCFIDRAFT_198645 [Pseudocercospora fijiensis CIRAD86]
MWQELAVEAFTSTSANCQNSLFNAKLCNLFFSTSNVNTLPRHNIHRQTPGASDFNSHNTVQHTHNSSDTPLRMANNATECAASVTMISSDDGAASEPAAAQQREVTSECQLGSESKEIAAGSSKKPVAIDAPQDTSDETCSGDGPQTASVVGLAEKNGKKRAGEEHDEEKQSKRAKTGEENGSAPGGEKAGETKKEETFEDLRARFNSKLRRHKDKINELEEELHGARNKLEEVEEDRDQWRSDCLDMRKKEETRIANKKEKGKNEEAHRKAVRIEDKKAIRADVERDVGERFEKAEKKLKGQLNTKAKNLGDDIERKREKIESLANELRELKADHRDEIRILKDKLKEAQKEGGPKAMEKVRQKDVELKEKDKEVEEWKRRGMELNNSITRLNSEVNAAKTGERQSQEALDNTFRENQTLQQTLAKSKRDLASWKANAMHANNNGEIREKQLTAKFKQTEENYRREVDSLQQRAKACDTFQQANRDLNRQNERNNELRISNAQKLELRISNAQKLADTQNQLQLAVIEKDRAQASEETLKVELQKLTDENKSLRKVFARAQISPPAAVLTSNPPNSVPASPSKDHNAGLRTPTTLDDTRPAEEFVEAAQDGSSASKSNAAWAFPTGI